MRKRLTLVLPSAQDIFLATLRSGMKSMNARSKDGLSCVIVEFGSINDVDVSALRMLETLYRELKEQKTRLLLASCKGPVREVFDRSGFMNEIRPSSLCVSLSEAVNYGARIHTIRTNSKPGEFDPSSRSPTTSSTAASMNSPRFSAELAVGAADENGHGRDHTARSGDHSGSPSSNLAPAQFAVASTPARPDPGPANGQSATDRLGSRTEEREFQYESAATPAWLRQAASILPDEDRDGDNRSHNDIPTTVAEEGSSDFSKSSRAVRSVLPSRARKFQTLEEEPDEISAELEIEMDEELGEEYAHLGAASKQ